MKNGKSRRGGGSVVKNEQAIRGMGGIHRRYHGENASIRSANHGNSPRG
jgi:hypothetical protein